MLNIVIKSQGLKKIYRLPAGDLAALNGVDVEIKQGEFVAIMGPSGSGKTTLLDLLGCLDEITSGSLEIMGKEVSEARENKLVLIRRKNIGFIFQEFFLIPTLTALENVELPLLFDKLPENRSRAIELLERVGLAARINHLPKKLSGGEQQRVAIARALMTSPKILLADEPTGNLDSKNSKLIFNLLRELNKEENLTMVVVTHNMELGNLADRIIFLQDGKIIPKEESSLYH
ncbi:MAG: ABC transporter ATP-binding protein [Candidatus Omnitrophota bacterium]|nr:ABC transporter ATP-binding protein [Candidatus Omnitrophota bacterium]